MTLLLRRWLRVLVALATLASVVVVSPASSSASDPPRGTLGDPSVVSGSAGEITVSWSVPDPVPDDYRIMWAEDSQSWLPWNAANEADRGSEYPDAVVDGVAVTSLTLSGLTPGDTYKVRARARYTTDGSRRRNWSGPWTPILRVTVSEESSASSLPRGSLGDPAVASGSAGEITVSWSVPDPVPDDYRIMWAEESQGWLSWNETNEADRGSEYPDAVVDGAPVTSLTLSGLTPGDTYKVRARARYTHDGDRRRSWSGPWTPILRVTVSETSADSSGTPEITTPAEIEATEGTTQVATMTASGADADPEDLTWSIPSGAAGGADASHFTLSSDGRLAFAAAKDFENPDDADSDGTYEVTVQVSDGATADTADFRVTLADRNEAPVADAGDDQHDVPSGAQVSLSGAGSDPDAGDTLTFAWTQTAGSSVSLAASDTPTATFTAPGDLAADATLEFALTVTDSEGLSHRDSVSVTVLAAAPSQAGAEDASADEEDATIPAPAPQTVVDSGMNSVSVRWSAPESPGTPITGYDVRYRAVGTPEWSDGPQGVTGTTAEITGLQADTEYEVAVRAQGDGAEGAWSASGRGFTAFWAATLTVGSLDRRPSGYWGFQHRYNRFGDLTPRSVTRDGVDYDFFILAWFRGYRRDADGGSHTEALDFYGYDHVMPADWMLRVGDRQFFFRDATRGFMQGISSHLPQEYKVYWRHPGLSFRHGSRIEVSLSQEPTGDSSDSVPE